MRRNLLCGVVMAATLVAFQTPLQAAPGQYWEIKNKMEMAGMPFAMPETTVKVCIPVGKENDPRATTKDKNCEILDLKTSGNSSKWKMRCNNDGEIMVGEGEASSSPDAFQGRTHISGVSHGEKIEMNQSYKGRKLGGSCDTEEQVKAVNKIQQQAQQQINKMCDTGNNQNGNLVGMADMFLAPGAMCAEQKNNYCATIRKDAFRDKDTYLALRQVDQNRQAGSRITAVCGIDLEASRQAVCSANRNGELSFLQDNCPAEAKAYLEAQRQQGRAYTGRAYTSANKSTSSAQAPAQGSTAGTVLENAKKLKGLFGF